MIVQSSYTLLLYLFQLAFYYIVVANSSIQSNNISVLETYKAIEYMDQPDTSVTVEVNAKSNLYVARGQSAEIYFDITNNMIWNNMFYFYCSTIFSTVRLIQPYKKWIFGQETVTVKVIIEIGDGASSVETITFSAVIIPDEDRTISKAYLFLNNQVADSYSPDISYSINGDCSEAKTPSTCQGARWGFQATIQDKQSGLLSVHSVPKGFNTDFTSGTRNQIIGKYSSSCCIQTVELIATDYNGNWCSVTIYNNARLSAATITAIVLGSILVAVLVILLCCSIIICIKKSRTNNRFLVNT